jgi:hypothetical protein
MSWRPDETSSMTNTYDRVKFGNVPKSYPHPTRVIAYTRDEDYMPRTCLERRGLILLKKGELAQTYVVQQESIPATENVHHQVICA